MRLERAPGVSLIAVVILAACSGSVGDSPGGDSPARAKQADVSGTVTLREGDCMPVTTPERCRLRPIATRVEVYPVIRLQKAGRNEPNQLVPNAKPVATTMSDADGRFALTLPEGRYTIITSYEGGWYPVVIGEDGEWAAVEVNAGWREDVELLINRATG